MVEVVGDMSVFVADITLQRCDWGIAQEEPL